MFRRLRDDEISALPLELKVCYMLQPWNTNISPKNIQEWAEEVGFFNYKSPGVNNNDEEAIKKAVDDANYHLNYIKNYIL